MALKKILRYGLFAVTFGWIGYLYYAIGASTAAPVSSRSLAIFAGVAIVVVGRVVQKLVNRQSAKSEGPSGGAQDAALRWLPSIEVLLAGGLLVALSYASVILWATRSGAPWAADWLLFTAPSVEKLSYILTAIENYGHQLTEHGYADRVPIVQHVAVMLWSWLFIVAAVSVAKFTASWKRKRDSLIEHVMTLKIWRIIFAIPILAGMVWAMFPGIVLKFGEDRHSFYDIIHKNDHSLTLNSIIGPFVILGFVTLLFYCVIMLLYRITRRMRDGKT
jgi:hypothetical protein